MRTMRLTTLGAMHMTPPVDWPTIPQTGPKADQVKEILNEDQTAARLPHRPLCPCAGCASHGGRSAGRRDLRWHPQDQRSRRLPTARAAASPRKSRNSRRRSRRSCRTARASRRTASSMSSSRTASCNIRPPSSSMKARTWRSASSFPKAKLIPPSEESFNHTARECRVGPDNKLYIQLGQPYNVPPKEKLDLYRQDRASAASFAWIRTARTARSMRRACAIRSGMDFNPKDKTLWTNDNQVDGMGDDIPPGEMNRIDQNRPELRLPVVRRRTHAHQRVQERDAAGRRRVPRGRAGCPCRRPRPDLLHRRHVPGEIPGRDLLDPAWLVEPHRAGRRAASW